MGNDVNVPQESYNKDFCLFLECHLSETFKRLGDNHTRGLWCDGVLMPSVASQISKKSVNDTRKIITKAWIGIDGQGEFELTIKFEKYSLRKYAKGSDLRDCVPSAETKDWIDIKLEERTIGIQLK